jgi:hypothetical protein
LRPAVLAALALAAVGSGGCVTLQSLCYPEQAPTGPACKVVARWEAHLVETPDSVNGGVPLRGLAGRMYLLGPDLPTGEVSPPVSGDGEVLVDLYDDRPMATGGVPVALERWQYPPDVLKKLLRKDVFGWGYTLFLPWVKTYRPDIAQVHIRLCYVPPGAAPLYFVSSTINLTPPEAVVAQAGGPKAMHPVASAMAQAGAQQMPAPGPTAAQRPPAGTGIPQAPPQGYAPAPAQTAPQGAGQGSAGVTGIPASSPQVTLRDLTQAAPQGPPSSVPAPALPEMPEPVRIPIRGNVPLPSQPASQTSAPPPAPASQPVQSGGWVGMAKQ